jgi:phasin
MADTTHAAKAKAEKQNASPFGIPNFGTGSFDLPKLEIPEAFRQATEQGVAQAKDTCDKAKVAAEQVADLLRDTYTTAAKGAADCNLKLFDIARINTATAFDHAQDLLGVTSPADFVALSTEHARKQFALMTEQTKELTEFAQRVTKEISEPLKAGATKSFGDKPVDR